MNIIMILKNCEKMHYIYVFFCLILKFQDRKYLSVNHYEKPIEKVNLQIDKTEAENKIVINDCFGYILYVYMVR